jgi:alpha-tubulin suppressor-like RCC1 family protein
VPSDVGASTAIAIGDRHGIALLENRTVRTWGSNAQGQLNVPVGIGACIAVAAGYYNSVALQADGVVRAWGNNTQGECNVPPDLVGVTSIAAAGYNVAAVQAKSFIELLSDATTANAALTASNAALTARLNCGDLNGDGEVNGADLGRMLISWGQCQ